MDWPSVYLIRIYHRSYGFRIVAVVHHDEESALEACHEKYHSQSEARNKRDYAEILDRCCVSECGNMAAMEFVE